MLLPNPSFERGFAKLPRKQIHRSMNRSTAEKEADVTAFIQAHNENPKPYKWVKSAHDTSQPSNASAQKTTGRTFDVGEARLEAG